MVMTFPTFSGTELSLRRYALCLLPLWWCWITWNSVSFRVYSRNWRGFPSVIMYWQILGTICTISSGLPVRFASICSRTFRSTIIWFFLGMAFQKFAILNVIQSTLYSDWSRRTYGSHWRCYCVWAYLVARPVSNKEALRAWPTISVGSLEGET